MKCSFISEKTDWNNIKYLVNNFFSELGYINDGFFNDMIFDGEPYYIKINGKF